MLALWAVRGVRACTEKVLEGGKDQISDLAPKEALGNGHPEMSDAAALLCTSGNSGPPPYL